MNSDPHFNFKHPILCTLWLCSLAIAIPLYLLLQNTHKWFLENDISSSGLQCHMECRLLADTKDTCSNEESTYDVDPTFTFWVYLVVRILNSLTLGESIHGKCK